MDKILSLATSMLLNTAIFTLFYVLRYFGSPALSVAASATCKTAIDYLQESYRQKRLNQQRKTFGRVNDNQEVEAAEWFNKIVSHIWMQVSKAVEKLMKESIHEQMADVLKVFHLSSSFKNVDLGTIPFKTVGLRVYDKTEDDEIVIDLGILYGGNCDLSLHINGIPLGLKDFQIEGTVRVVLKPIIEEVPIIGGIEIFFLNCPDLDFDFVGVTKILEWPGIRYIFRHVISKVIKGNIVYPNKQIIEVSHLKGVREIIKTPRPAGVLRVHIIEAQNLIDVDIISKSDPYVVIEVGALTSETEVINNDLNPVWNYYCEFIVDYIGGQKVLFSIWDKDFVGKGDPLGNASLDVETVFKNKKIDTWLPLENVSNGKLHVELVWCSFSRSSKDITNILRTNETYNDHADVNSALLVVYIESAEDLPKEKYTPNCRIKMTLGEVTKYTTTICSNNPEWDEGFIFFVRNPHDEKFELEVEDLKSKAIIGTFTFMMESLLEKDKLQLPLQKHSLKESGKNSGIFLSMQLNIMKIEDH